MAGLMYIIASLISLAFGALAIYFVIIHRQLARFAREAKAAAEAAVPPACPKCGSTDHDFATGGLYDGRDDRTNKSTSGSFQYCTCKACGARWGQWDAGTPYLVSDEEWKRHVDLHSPVAGSDHATRLQESGYFRPIEKQS